MNLTVASSPHVRGDFKTSRIMLDVVLALLPALIVGIAILGIRAGVVALICVAMAVAAAASSYQKVGGVTTAHSISYWNTSISFTYI